MTDENNKNTKHTAHTNQSLKTTKSSLALVILAVSSASFIFCACAYIGAAFPDFPWADTLLICAGIAFLSLFWLSAYNRGYKRGVNSFNQAGDEDEE